MNSKSFTTRNLSGAIRQSFYRARGQHRDYRRDVDDQRAFKLSMRQMNEYCESKYGYQERTADEHCARDQKQERAGNLTPTEHKSHGSRHKVGGRRRTVIKKQYRL